MFENNRVENDIACKSNTIGTFPNKLMVRNFHRLFYTPRKCDIYECFLKSQILYWTPYFPQIFVSVELLNYFFYNTISPKIYK